MIVAGFILIVVFVINSIISNLNSPVSGKVTVGNDTAHPNTTIRVNLKPKLQNGTFVSFYYPTGLSPRPTNNPITAPDLENYTYRVADITSWLLSVNISILKGATLSGDSGYLLRFNDPATYKESTVSANNQSYTVFSDQNAAFSKVAYIIHGNKLASITLSGDDNAGTKPLDTSFMMVLNSLTWH
jgi:hypothetical protein